MNECPKPLKKWVKLSLFAGIYIGAWLVWMVQVVHLCGLSAFGAMWWETVHFPYRFLLDVPFCLDFPKQLFVFTGLAIPAVIIVWGLLTKKRWLFYILLSAFTALVAWDVFICFRSPYNLDSLRVPPGYTFQHGNGTDSYCGTLSKKGGLSIGFDVGLMAGIWANPNETDKYLWFRETYLNGCKVYLSLRDDRGQKWFAVTYADNWANFFCRVSSDADIAEMVSVISTYKAKRFPSKFR